MIEQQGRVVRLDGQMVSVRVGAAAGCPACEAGQGCGAGIFGRLLRRKPVQVQLPNTVGAREGDLVAVGIPEQEFLRLLMKLYLFPLVSGLAGAIIGHHISGSVGAGESVRDASAFCAGALSGGLALWFSGRSRLDLNGAVNLQLVQAVPARPEGLRCPAGLDAGD